jgi:PilZ domain
MLSSKDRRKHQRFETLAYVDYTGKEFLFNQEVYDISASGIRFYSSELAEMDDEVDLVISFPNQDDLIETKGTIVWVSQKPEPAMGIKFKALGIKESRLLQEYLKKVESKK